MNTGIDGDDQKRDCIVIDTCIWRSDLLLKTSIGVSLIYTLGRQNGFIGLPEIIKRELPQNVVEHGLEAAENLKKWFQIINILTDSLFTPSLPTKIILENIVDARIIELAPILVSVPFTLEDAKAALDMVNAKKPPNAKNQQFKDSLLWRAILTFSRDYRVHFVTNDRAFLQDPNDPSKGLAQNLKQDVARIEGNVDIYCDLGSCLKAITRDVPSFDQDRLSSLIERSVFQTIEREAIKNNFQIIDIHDTKIEAFKTEKANRIAIDYSVIMKLEANPSVITDGRIDCRGIIRGSCYYETGTDSLSNECDDIVQFYWKNPHGGFGSISQALGNQDSAIPFPRPDLWDRPDD